MIAHSRAQDCWIIIDHLTTIKTNAITGDPSLHRTRDVPHHAWADDHWVDYRTTQEHLTEFNTKDAAEQYIRDNQSKLSSAR
jgi:hypothetical protein